MFYVEIKRIDNDEISRRIEAGHSERQAECVERGIHINLNHESFYTAITEED